MAKPSEDMIKLAVRTAHELDAISWVSDCGAGRCAQTVGGYDELTEQERENLEMIVLPNGLRFQRLPPQARASPT